MILNSGKFQIIISDQPKEIVLTRKKGASKCICYDKN